MLEKIKKHKFAIGIILISIIYFIFTSAQNPNCNYYAGSDDYLILHEAKALLDFKWVGHFWGRTLSKGPGAPIFIVIANFVGLSFIQAQFLLYIGASILFANVLKKVIKSDFVKLVVFTIVLFNPVIYDTELLRVYRDGINCSFLLIVVSCAFGIFFNYKEEIKKIIPYMVGFGIFATWMAITREEAIWIAPFVLGSSIITILFIIFDKTCLNKVKRCCLYFIPLSIYLITIFIVCLFNRIAYGEFVRVEQNSKPYKDFIKAASSVDVDEPMLKVDVTTEAREKLYEVSPTFSKLKSYLESNDPRRNFKVYGTIPNEIENGWFMWAVYLALDEVDEYSENVKTYNDAFRKMADEINKAYEDGRLKKEDNPVSIFDKENLEKLFETFVKAYKFQIELKNNYVKSNQEAFLDLNSPEILLERKEEFFEVIGDFSSDTISNNYKIDEIKINTLDSISTIYEKLSKPLFYLGILFYILMIIRFLFIKPRFKNYKEIIILTSFLMLQFIRVLVIAYVDTKLCDAVSLLYLSSTYSLQFAFEILSPIFGTREIYEFIKGKINDRKVEEK